MENSVINKLKNVLMMFPVKKFSTFGWLEMYWVSRWKFGTREELWNNEIIPICSTRSAWYTVGRTQVVDTQASPVTLETIEAFVLPSHRLNLHLIIHNSFPWKRSVEHITDYVYIQPSRFCVTKLFHPLQHFPYYI